MQDVRSTSCCAAKICPWPMSSRSLQPCLPGPARVAATALPPCAPWAAGRPGLGCGPPCRAVARSMLPGTQRAAAAAAAAAAAVPGAAAHLAPCPAASLARPAYRQSLQRCSPSVAAAPGQAGAWQKGAQGAHRRAWRHRRQAAAGPPWPRHPACRELSKSCRRCHDAVEGGGRPAGEQQGLCGYGSPRVQGSRAGAAVQRAAVGSGPPMG